MDVFSKKKRSDIMSKIRSKNSRAELAAFNGLKKRGIKFLRHYNDVPGKPDAAVPSKKKALFIDGDFWHGRNFLKLKKRLPKVYWVQKIQSNISRDRKQNRLLKKSGWQVLRIWEKDLIASPSETIEKIARFFGQTSRRLGRGHQSRRGNNRDKR